MVDVQAGALQSQTVRVIAIDDHDLFRNGLAMLLRDEPGIEVVGQASGGRTGVRLVAELRPEVVLMDMRMPDLDGPEATRQILAADPSVRVIALTVASDDGQVALALAAGACGYLAKDTSISDLAVAIRAAASGAAWLSPKAAEVVLGRLRTDGTAPRLDGRLLERLSPREAGVLRLVARGLDNNEIAAELQISPRTAKNHVSNILAKLGVSSRLLAAVYAVREGVS